MLHFAVLPMSRGMSSFGFVAESRARFIRFDLEPTFWDFLIRSPMQLSLMVATKVQPMNRIMASMV